MRILITGATGLIGRELGKVLAARGHDLFVISRRRSKAREELPFPCDILEGDLSRAPLQDPRLQSVQAVVNLLGEPVMGGRWTTAKKARIYQSRVIGTRNLVASVPANLQTFVSGSAIGFYGDRGEEIIHEEAAAGTDFLARVCRDWEAEAALAPGRKVILRTGVVLARQGGALEAMLFPFRAGLGGPLGSGRAYLSWIHLEDLVGLIGLALENPNVSGPLNGTAPYPVTNREFSETLARALAKRLGPRVPTWALRLILGEAAGAVLGSLRASATKALTLGYTFRYLRLSEALADLCAPYRDSEELLLSEQFLPIPPEQAFPFFQDPYNLEKITPPTLRFHIRKLSSPVIQQGTLIDYTLKIRGIPARWRTEIDEWRPPERFVDTQLRGPYRLWHHTHEFRSFRGGTLMVDRVRYRLPLGFLGWLVAGWFVRRDVQKIFAFRRKFIADQLADPKSPRLKRVG